ncbi:MAG: hypothetical protein C0598_04295 [Marinilabiliales bacterium]|nr:MAG: hypothetical protein C0598_04295 [Marinilabiliales bacterium]
MKNIILILLLGLPMVILAQNLVLPDDAKKDLKKVKKSKNIKTPDEKEGVTDSVSSDAVLDSKYLNNFLEVRVEYVLQYKKGNEFITLAKDENNYFGYNIVYGAAGDGMLWLNDSQLKPWLEDDEYKYYKNDTLFPAVSMVLARNIGDSDFELVKSVAENINVLNKNIKAYNLDEDSESFKVSYSDDRAEKWILAFNKESEFGSKPEVNLFAIHNTNEADIKENFEVINSDGVYNYGIVVFSEEGFTNPEISDIISLSGSNVDVEDVIYKKSLKVISKETTSTCNYCCEKIDKYTSKDEYKKIISKWESAVKSAKEKLKEETDEQKSIKLNNQINECEAKLKEHKKGFLGIKFLK